MEIGFFGSAILWLLVTFPAYWLYQWTIEGEPFALWQRRPREVAVAIGEEVGQRMAAAGASLSVATQSQLTPTEPSLDATVMS